MTLKRVLLRMALLAASTSQLGQVGITAGCVRERHLVGEGERDARGPTADGAAGTEVTGATDTGAREAAGDALTTIGDVGGVGTDGGGALPDASPGGATVVSLGDKASLGWTIAITPEEVARRLSQFLMRKVPSASLIAGVVASAPKTNQDVGQLTEGLLLQEATLAGRQAFYRWWLSLDALVTAPRDMALFPTFTNDVRLAQIDQTLTFVEDVTWRPQGDLSTLLTEPAAFVTTATAPWFPGAVVPVGSTATRIVLAATQFAGIVTQPAVVAVADGTAQAHPSTRGRQVRTRYLCDLIPTPPPSTVLGETKIPPGLTLRQAIEAATGQAACGACHNLLDPPGFAFGHFDAVGAFHDTEAGLPVDTKGVLRSLSTGVELAFEGAPDLAGHLAQLPQVRTCYATKWLAFASGKFSSGDQVGIATSPDPLAVDADYVVRRATIQGRLHLRGTIRAVTESHTFLDP